MTKVLLVGFLAGALAVIAFHQALVHVLHFQFAFIQSITGLPDAFRPQGSGFNMRPVPPFGVPQVASLAFWGGVWGILLAAMIRWLRAPDLLMGVLIGLVATLAAFTLLAQLRGAPMWAGGNTILWWRAILLNVAWGWGTAFLMRPFQMTRGG